jgi:peptide/nickel transport system permease protein
MAVTNQSEIVATLPGSSMVSQVGRGWVRVFTHNRRAMVGLVILAVFVAIAVLGFWPIPYSTSATFGPLMPPSSAHWLGTTDQGQDVLSEFIQGTQASLWVGLTAGGGATILSMIVGMVSGYVGGIVDEVLQAVVNIFLILPGLPLMIVLAAYIPFGGNVPIIVVVALTGWAWGARVLRSQVLGLRSAAFVDAAVLAGQNQWRIVFREIMPNMLSLVFANFLFSVIYAILAAASLQFLGLGNLNTISWGTMLYWAENDGALMTGAWWWFIPPGLAIAVFGAGLTLVNYALDEITNPRLRTAHRRKERSRHA